MKWDVNNPDHRTVLETARSWGLSPSAFVNGPKSETLYQYDDSGRLVRTETKSLDWDEDSVEAAMALRAWEMDLCPGCHTPMSETTAIENQYRYTAELPVRCHKCTAISMVSDRYSEQDHSTALFMNVHLKEPEGDAGP